MSRPATGQVVERGRGKRATPGIEVRHGRGCPAAVATKARCRCEPSYRAWVFSPRDGKKVRKTFPTLAAAKAWRADSVGDIRRGKLRAAAPATLRQAAKAWLEGAKDGSVRTRSGDPFKPSTIRGYEEALENRILPEIGSRKLADVQRRDLQDFADHLLAEGLDPSTIRNALMPVRAIYRRALTRGDVAVNPTTGLELPAVRGRRDRIASPDEAAKLLEALAVDDADVWATALYAGLRRGELMALRWQDVDLAAGVIRVERSWDAKSRVIVAPKSRAGKRKVPIPAVLRGHLVERKLRTGGKPDELVFGVRSIPFDPSALAARAQTKWGKPKLEPITLHEARHTFASLMIAAGVNAKALSSYMGHARVVITYDRYGHLMPGNEDEAAALLDAYLERANTAAQAGRVSG